MAFFELTLRAESEDYPSVVETASFLYDFALMYEIARLASDSNHKNYEFSESTWARDHRPLSTDEQLHVVKLRQESPLELIAAITAVPAAVGALWGMVQVVDKIANWPLNRQLLKLQRDKLVRELSNMELASPVPEPLDIREILEARDGAYMYDETIRRMESSSMKITSFDVKIVQRLPPKRSSRRDPAAR